MKKIETIVYGFDGLTGLDTIFRKYKGPWYKNQFIPLMRFLYACDFIPEYEEYKYWTKV